MRVFVFDIETIPDVESGRRLFQLENMTDAEVAETMFTLRREKTGSDFLQHHLHRIVAISAVFRINQSIKVWSLGSPDSDEKELIQRFYEGIEKYSPTLLTWNGGGFDLPVLHYRTLYHGISAPRYWETGDHDQTFRWNNYISRYHSRHTDLMDVLAGYQMRANAPLDQIACMLGFPGKMGMSGSKVWENFLAGGIEGIRNYCETDVLNTYLVYLRFELMRGNLTQTAYHSECELLKKHLAEEAKPHLTEFLETWNAMASDTV